MRSMLVVVIISVVLVDSVSLRSNQTPFPRHGLGGVGVVVGVGIGATAMSAMRWGCAFGGRQRGVLC